MTTPTRATSEPQFQPVSSRTIPARQMAAPTMMAVLHAPRLLTRATLRHASPGRSQVRGAADSDASPPMAVPHAEADDHSASDRDQDTQPPDQPLDVARE